MISFLRDELSLIRRSNYAELTDANKFNAQILEHRLGIVRDSE